MEDRRLSLWHVEALDRSTLQDLSACVLVHHKGRIDVACRVLAVSDEAASAAAAAESVAAFRTEPEEEFLRRVDGRFPPGHYGLDALLTDHRRRVLQSMLQRGSPERHAVLAAWSAAVRPLLRDPAADAGEALHRLADAVVHGIPPDSLPDVDALRQSVCWRFKELLVRPGPESLFGAEALFEGVLRAGLHLPVWDLRRMAMLALDRWPGAERPDALVRLAARLRLDPPAGARPERDGAARASERP